MNWKKLESIEDLEAAIEASNKQAVALFKHSTRCAVSTMAKRLVEREWNLNIDAYFLDLIAHRDISNAIAERLQVQHQSPQMIVVKNGAAVYDASHESIQVAAMAEAL
jgi:bacillithiol system protein YtxJ